MIRVTHLLDAASIESLVCLTKAWRVSRSEALRRAIRIALQVEQKGASALEALDRLQSSAQISHAQARRWAARVRATRRAGH